MTVRKRFIIDCVERYKKEYSEQYDGFLAIIKQRRNNLDDKKFAELRGSKEIRACLSLPEKLFQMISQGLDGINNKKFLEEKGEEAWFAKKYPEFLVPNTY